MQANLKFFRALRVWAFVSVFVLGGVVAAHRTSYAETIPPPVLSGYQPSAPLNTRGDYISVGVKGVFWGNKTISADLNAAGEANSGRNLEIEYDDAIYYHLTLGNALDLPLLRFRYDIELYFGDHSATLTRDNNMAEGEFSVYGLNLNALYDLPTFFRLTPYAGASAMAVGMKLEFEEGEAEDLDSSAIADYLGDSTDFSSTDGFNLLYGYGFMAGARLELSTYLALDANYRLIRFEDCVISKGCGLLLQETVHEARAELVLRY